MKPRKMTPAERVVMDEIRERTLEMAGSLRHVAELVTMSANGNDPASGAGYLIALRSSLSHEIQILRPLLKVEEAIPVGVTR